MPGDCRTECRWEVDVPLRHGIGDLVNPYAACGQGLWIKLGAHRVLLGTEHLYLGHALDHGDALGDKGVRVFIDRIERQGRRTQSKVNDGLVGRVDLAEGWW